MQMAERMLENAGIEAKSLPRKLFLPIMERASLEDDDGLREKWAALLANASRHGAESVSPSFPQILHQLSPNEAKFLDAIFDQLIVRFEHGYGTRDSLKGNVVHEIGLGPVDGLLEIYSNAGLTRVPWPLVETIDQTANADDTRWDQGSASES